jgi:hypothetical protein
VSSGNKPLECLAVRDTPAAKTIQNNLDGGTITESARKQQRALSYTRHTSRSWRGKLISGGKKKKKMMNSCFGDEK